MPVYLVTFELNYDKSHYDELFMAIKKYSHWYRQSDNVWFVKPVTHNATDIRNHLAKYIFQGDRLFVIKVVKGWAATGYSERAYNWLKINVTDK